MQSDLAAALRGGVPIGAIVEPFPKDVHVRRLARRVNEIQFAEHPPHPSVGNLLERDDRLHGADHLREREQKVQQLLLAAEPRGRGLNRFRPLRLPDLFGLGASPRRVRFSFFGDFLVLLPIAGEFAEPRPHRFVSKAQTLRESRYDQFLLHLAGLILERRCARHDPEHRIDDAARRFHGRIRIAFEQSIHLEVQGIDGGTEHLVEDFHAFGLREQIARVEAIGQHRDREFHIL